nr:cold-regulated 413 plasma membrane protein 2 [Tanacetum cinerariifolium]
MPLNVAVTYSTGCSILHNKLFMWIHFHRLLTRILGPKGSAFFLSWVASFSAMGQCRMWVAFVAVVLRLFFPRHFRDWLEMP